VNVPHRVGLARKPRGPGKPCAACNARVIWALTDVGRHMPVDPEPTPAALLPEAREGNVVLWYEVDEKDRPVGQQRVSYATEEQRRDPNVSLWLSHFATCPRAAEFRRRRSVR
jgi:hypothetical protein